MSENFHPRVTISDSDIEPQVTKVISATAVIDDGKGGRACLDISEVNDVVKQLATLLKSDAPAVKVIDLSQQTGA